MNKQIKIVVNGRVQGVWFRKAMKDVASKFDLVGYAKNNNDGTVEIIACGNDVYFDDFIVQVKKGSKLSRVDNIVYDIHDKCDKEYNDFKIL